MPTFDPIHFSSATSPIIEVVKEDQIESPLQRNKSQSQEDLEREVARQGFHNSPISPEGNVVDSLDEMVEDQIPQRSVEHAKKEIDENSPSEEFIEEGSSYSEP